MLFSLKERKAFMHIIDRKVMEISVYNAMENMPIAYRTAFTSQLEYDIARCKVYLRIFSNDFGTIMSDLDVIAPREKLLPIDLHRHYLESLTSDEMEEESLLMFCDSLVIDLYFDIRSAKNLLDAAGSSGNLVSYSEFITVQKVKQLFEGSLERCKLLLDETDLPYDEAYDYIECMMEECSIITTIHLSKEIGLDALFLHLDYCTKVDPEAYNKLFLPEIEVERRHEILDFQKKAKEHRILVLAQILNCYELGVY